MKRSYVPEALRDPAGDPPYSLACIPDIPGQCIPLAGVIVPVKKGDLGVEIEAVMAEVFRRVDACGLTPDDITHMCVIVGPDVDLNDAKTAATLNGAYVRAFLRAISPTIAGSVFPVRAVFGSTTLFGFAKIEVVPTVFVEA